MNEKDFYIKFISTEETRPLRQLILRPHQKAEELIYQGDDEKDTVHFGAFYKDELIGIASVYNEPMKNNTERNSWRLRGMAVTNEVRGKGFGNDLMKACIEYIKSKKGKFFWCNARTPAEKFYEKFGMRRIGDIFYPEGLGPHIVMIMEIKTINNKTQILK